LKHMEARALSAEAALARAREDLQKMKWVLFPTNPCCM
jgi:protein arginine N-methyltransferase 3